MKLLEAMRVAEVAGEEQDTPLSGTFQNGMEMRDFGREVVGDEVGWNALSQC